MSIQLAASLALLAAGSAVAQPYQGGSAVPTVEGIRNAGVSAPSVPQPTTRPATWPGSPPLPQNSQVAAARPPFAPDPRAGLYQPPLPVRPASAEIASFDGVQILATVGPDAILSTDVMSYVNDILHANQAQIPPDQLDQAREMLIRARLRQLIETKTIYNDARTTLPPEAIKNIETSIGENFDKEDLLAMLKKTNTQSPAQLDERLRRMGTSLDNERRAFIESTLAKEWVRKNIRDEFEKEVTHDEMLAYYREHAAEYAIVAKVRWQHLMIKAGTTRSKGEAWLRIDELRKAILNGVPFAEVVRKHSEGTAISDGGVHDWTTQGSLVSQVLDQAIFNLEVGRVSPIFEDEQGFHVVLVLERQPAGKVSFAEAQTEIKKKIKQGRIDVARAAYIAGLRQRTKVWTIFDRPTGLNGPGNPTSITERPTAPPR